MPPCPSLLSGRLPPRHVQLGDAARGGMAARGEAHPACTCRPARPHPLAPPPTPAVARHRRAIGARRAAVEDLHTQRGDVLESATMEQVGRTASCPAPRSRLSFLLYSHLVIAGWLLLLGGAQRPGQFQRQGGEGCRQEAASRWSLASFCNKRAPPPPGTHTPLPCSPYPPASHEQVALPVLTDGAAEADADDKEGQEGGAGGCAEELARRARCSRRCHTACCTRPDCRNAVLVQCCPVLHCISALPAWAVQRVWRWMEMQRAPQPKRRGRGVSSGRRLARAAHRGWSSAHSFDRSRHDACSRRRSLRPPRPHINAPDPTPPPCYSAPRLLGPPARGAHARPQEQGALGARAAGGDRGAQV